MKGIPIYATRKTATGVVGSVTLPAWMILTALVLVWANIICWGVFGLVALAEKAIG